MSPGIRPIVYHAFLNLPKWLVVFIGLYNGVFELGPGDTGCDTFLSVSGAGINAGTLESHKGLSEQHLLRRKGKMTGKANGFACPRFFSFPFSLSDKFGFLVKLWKGICRFRRSRHYIEKNINHWNIIKITKYPFIQLWYCNNRGLFPNSAKTK